MNVLVTGGAGFIGSNTCRLLTATPGIGTIRVLDDLSTGLASNLDGLDVELVVDTICDPAAVMAATEGIDAVIHLAARASVPRSIADPMATHAVNATGTMHVLEAARARGAQVIVASSSSVYGANPVLPKHEDLTPRPVSPYAASKLATETSTLAHGHAYGMHTLAFRFFNVFGPGQRADHVYAAVVPAFLDAALGGRPVTVHGDGTQSRDFTYVGTVARVLVDAVVRRVSHPTPVNLAFGSRTSLLALLDLMSGLLGHEIERDHVESRAGDVPHSQADATRLLTLFADVDPVPLDVGLKETIDWMAHLGAGRPTPAR